MLKNHLRYAWRTLARHKGYTLINVFGLALGLCACISIYTITHYEFSFDDFHPGKARIYRIGARISENNGAGVPAQYYGEDIPSPAPAFIRADVPGIETVAAYYPYGDATIITTNDYFHIFHYDWLAGNAATALNTPNTIVLSESEAIKQFGRHSPDTYIDKVLTVDDSLQLHVTGIIKDWTGNTDFPYSRFISFPTIAHSSLRNQFKPHTWQWSPATPYIRTLIKLKPSSDPSRIETQVAAILPRYHPTDTLLSLIHFQLVIQPLSDIHFNEAYAHDGARKAHLPALYGLMGSAVFILLLAIVNFINLSTAQSLRRAKETGVRKILGGSKTQLILRFLTETAIITLLAAILAISLVSPLLSLFRSYLPADAQFHPLAGSTLLFTFAVIGITTLLAGFYPARVLAAYAPSVSLKTNPKDRQWFIRKSLIVFQFTISCIFIIASVTAGRQLRYMLDADMGIATNAVITVNNYHASQNDLRRFAARAAQIPGIKELTLQSYAPAASGTIEQPIRLDGRKETDLWVKLQGADQQFVPFYRLPILAGHNLPAGDSLNGFLINATYCRTLGFAHPTDAIGHSLSINGAPSWPITGVVADYHQGSLHDPIIPVLIGHLTNIENNLAIRLPASTSAREALPEATASGIAQTLSRLESTWKTIVPDHPFSYTFLDESIGRLYQSDKQLSRLVRAATAVTIFISCMGLIGLAAFTAEQRKKEIAVRKVLGAGIANIMLLLTKDFVILLAIAFLIATPFSAYALHRWLENYTYRIPLSAWIFALSALTLLGITLLTIAFRLIGAAIQNPIDHLRSE
jgi:cell division protein FtsX